MIQRTVEAVFFVFLLILRRDHGELVKLCLLDIMLVSFVMQFPLLLMFFEHGFECNVVFTFLMVELMSIPTCWNFCFAQCSASWVGLGQGRKLEWCLLFGACFRSWKDFLDVLRLSQHLLLDNLNFHFVIRKSIYLIALGAFESSEQLNISIF